ncbi:hypothetical protein V6R21_09115 [Limibacter armeniacum]|uniref:hypothetical protein n=1 Tax=Limibacter armeniacum TaxID=466084 RepID=UPI002FE533CD
MKSILEKLIGSNFLLEVTAHRDSPTSFTESKQFTFSRLEKKKAEAFYKSLLDNYKVNPEKQKVEIRLRQGDKILKEITFN